MRNDDEKSGRTVTITTEDMQRKKNDVKAITTLLLSLPDEHQLRLQVIVSQLQFMDVEVKKDDLNQKFLTSLAPEWLMHTIVWRNKNDLNTMSLDDLYNHLKVYEAKVQKKSNSNSQNMAFISSSKHSSGDEDGNTACVPTGSASVATISQDTASDYIAFQSRKISSGKKISIQRSDVAGFNKSKVECFNCHKMGHFARECRAPKIQERGRKDNYRQGSKAKEKTPKAFMEIDGVGLDWSYMGNEGEDHALVADAEALSEFALMANTESMVSENSLCSNDCRKNNDSLNSKIKDLTNELFEANNYIYLYKLAVVQLEGRLVEYKEREVKYIEKIRTLEMYRESNLKCIETLSKQLETLKLEKDGVDGKLASLLKASKNLDNLIESQRPHGAPMRPPHRSAGHRPHGAPMRPPHRSGGHRPHGPLMNPMRPNMNEEIFPLSLGNFPLLAENLPLVAQKDHSADMERKGKAVKPLGCWT
nr:hypothetical protein [Tanacetum cinerariifolium]